MLVQLFRTHRVHEGGGFCSLAELVRTGCGSDRYHEKRGKLAGFKVLECRLGECETLRGGGGGLRVRQSLGYKPAIIEGRERVLRHRRRRRKPPIIVRNGASPPPPPRVLLLTSLKTINVFIMSFREKKEIYASKTSQASSGFG